MWTKFINQVRTSYATQALFDVTTFLGLVPEEILTLGQLVTLTLGTLHWFQRIRVIARIPGLCRDGHGGRCEVLHLLQLEIQPLGGNG
jgi:hypothetical protein